MEANATNRYQEIIQIGEPSLAVHKLVTFLTEQFAGEAQNPEKRLLLEVAGRELIRTIAASTSLLNDKEIEQKACYEVVQALLTYNKQNDLVLFSMN